MFAYVFQGCKITLKEMTPEKKTILPFIKSDKKLKIHI